MTSYVGNLVSVVIPVYNGATHLRQAIESAISQGHPNVEVVVVDDGSTDASPSILSSFGSTIRVVRQPNAGVGAARNVGIAKAKGEFVAFLDQDDWWKNEKLARQVDMFRHDGTIGLVHTGVQWFDENAQSFCDSPNPRAKPETIVGECFDRLLLGNPITNSSVMVRRSMLDEVGMCDSRIVGNTVQDYDLWLRIARRANFAFEQNGLTVFRLHGEQGHRNRIAMLTQEIEVLFRLLPNQYWKASALRRRRMGELHDEVAVAYFDSGSAAKAREYFASALRWEPTLSRRLRAFASLWPMPLASLARRSAWTARRVGRAITSAIRSSEGIQERDLGLEERRI